MKTYHFTVILVGVGNNPDEAWMDAVSAVNLHSDPTPEEYELITDDDDDYYDQSYNDDGWFQDPDEGDR